MNLNAYCHQGSRRIAHWRTDAHNQSIKLELHPCVLPLYKGAKEPTDAAAMRSSLAEAGMILHPFEKGNYGWGFGGCGRLNTYSDCGIINFPLPITAGWSRKDMEPVYNLLATLQVVTKLLESHNGEGGWDSPQGLTIYHVYHQVGKTHPLWMFAPRQLTDELQRKYHPSWQDEVGQAMYEAHCHMANWWEHKAPYWLVQHRGNFYLDGPDGCCLYGGCGEMAVHADNKANPHLNGVLTLTLLAGGFKLQEMVWHFSP